MKKYFFSLCFWLAFTAHGQMDTTSYKFDDGSKILVLFLSKDPDFIRKHALNVELTSMGNGSFYMLGYTYIQPRNFHIQTRLGLSNVYADMSYWILHDVKDKKIKQSVKTVYLGNNTTKAYMVNFIVPKRRSFGPRIGFNVSHKGIVPDFTNAILGPSVFVGVSYYTNFQASLCTLNKRGKNFVGDRTRSGANMKRINADVSYYFNHGVQKVTDYETVNLKTFTSRLYLEGRFTGWKARNEPTLFFNYLLGASISALNYNNVTPILGIGLTVVFK